MYYLHALIATIAFTSTFLQLPFCVKAASKEEYIAHAVNATETINNVWYHPSNGQWDSRWFISSNCLATIAGLTPLSTDIRTFAPGMFSEILTNAAKSNGGNFLNDYYDDDGWWALAWIKVFDVTRDPKYLTAAEDIFADMLTANGATCGGIWWTKDRNSSIAIANELYLAVAASLANRICAKRSYYREYAQSQIDWYLRSGLIKQDHTIWNELNLKGCTPEGPTFTYDSGVIIGALVEMSKLTGNCTYLDTATSIAMGSMKSLVDSNGILTEYGYPNSNQTWSVFKGAFARNLMTLQQAAPDRAYVGFLQRNADSIWSKARASNGTFAANWQGPQNFFSLGSSCSALDCLVAAAAIS